MHFIFYGVRKIGARASSRDTEPVTASQTASSSFTHQLDGLL